jgi:hypothetical protein
MRKCIEKLAFRMPYFYFEEQVIILKIKKGESYVSNY